MENEFYNPKLKIVKMRYFAGYEECIHYDEIAEHFVPIYTFKSITHAIIMRLIHPIDFVFWKRKHWRDAKWKKKISKWKEEEDAQYTKTLEKKQCK